MYRIIRNVLIIVTVMLCTAVCASANSDYCVSGAMITKYNGNADIVTVPEVIDGVQIAGIDSYAFVNKDMHTVVIEDGIEVIQPKAFVGCDNLEYIKSPESMLLINENAFFECFSLSKLDVSENTYVMQSEPVSLLSEEESENYNGFLYSDNTITGYTGEETEITIPDSINDVTITTIAASAFEGNTTITSVAIPDNVTTIGSYAFKGCTALTKVSLTKKLSTAGTDVFSGCSSLESITIPGTLKRVSKNMFYGCNALTDVVLESGVNKVGPYAFYKCVNLESVEVPETLTMVETWAFGFCEKLKTFYIPTSCTLLDSAAFYYCNALNNIQIPDTVTTIGTHCFRACMGLSNITLSKTLKAIQYRTFNGCAFSRIDIPDSVTSIGAEAFYQCKQLENIEISKKVSSVGSGAFYGCTALKRMIIYGTDTVLGKIFTSSEGTSMGKNTILYVVKNSAPEQAVKENGIPYKSIYGTANVIETEYLINGEEDDASNKTMLVEDDSVYVKYTIINVGEEEQDLCIMICLYDGTGRFLTTAYETDSISINKCKEIETDITVSEGCYAKVILIDSLKGLFPLFGVKEI